MQTSKYSECWFLFILNYVHKTEDLIHFNKNTDVPYHKPLKGKQINPFS